MKKLLLIAGMLAGGMLRAQNLYDLNTIQTIEIQFSQSNWDYMLDTATSGSEGYVMASYVKINGVQYDSVGVKYKGNSSYNANQVKNPLHIELDTYINQDHQGYTDIKLSNVAKDPSFLREVLSYQILRQYMHAPEANYANVYINGTLIGLYSNAESISKKFVSNHFYGNDGAFFKCNPIGGAGPGATDLPNLVYLGSDSSLYQASYEQNSTYGWNELVALCDTLSNFTSSIENILDVDRALWMLASDNVMVNLDSYIGGFSQNYYLYRDHYGKFNCVVWDLNESFGTFSMTGTTNLTSTSSKQQMTHLLHLNDAAWPLVKKLLSVPMYKRMYIAHMKTILEENFSGTTLLTQGQSLQTIINNAVNADPNKFFTYTQYQNNLTTDVSSGMTSAPGLTNLMNARYTYLMAQSDFTATQPSISGITSSSTNPALNSSVTITATIANANSNGVYLGFRYAVDAHFSRVLMYDDGAHNDGASGDGIYGADIAVNSSYIQYYIYAENNNAGKFSPARAEHEYYALYASIPLIAAGDITINEILASNTSGMTDASGAFEDWIELYNTTSNYLSLDNLYLSDNYLIPLKWAFPEGTTIAPNDYLIIWADGDTTESGLHSSFKLSSSGEELILSYANGTVIDSISFGTQSSDISYGRYPNGTGPFTYLFPTYAAENMLVSVEEIGTESTFVLYPNPSRGQITIASDSEPIERIEVYDLSGRLVFSKTCQQVQLEEFELNSLDNGTYVVRINARLTSRLVLAH